MAATATLIRTRSAVESIMTKGFVERSIEQCVLRANAESIYACMQRLARDPDHWAKHMPWQKTFHTDGYGEAYPIEGGFQGQPK